MREGVDFFCCVTVFGLVVGLVDRLEWFNLELHSSSHRASLSTQGVDFCMHTGNTLKMERMVVKFSDGMEILGINSERNLGGMVPTALVIIEGLATSRWSTNTPYGADMEAFTKASSGQVCESTATSTSILVVA
ncbi:hypothetical protein BGZ63DRAFT_399478 [Mariannaea sp. PMI_226]|nr:hypothetical protein BGZ63DRAFT_399478 [Mariannaea sp. PMI_226]